MSDMPWSSGLLFIACAFALASLFVIWACAYFGPEKYELRAIKRKRKLRRRALQFLHSTAERDVYNEFKVWR